MEADGWIVKQGPSPGIFISPLYGLGKCPSPLADCLSPYSALWCLPVPALEVGQVIYVVRIYPYLFKIKVLLKSKILFYY